MIKGIDVKKAVVKTIHSHFEEKVLSSEAKSDLKRPYFFVYMESFERQSYSNSNDYVTYGVVVQFQKAEKNALMETGDKLSEIFNYCYKIDDLRVLITNNRWEIDDNALFMYFDVSFYVNKLKNVIDYDFMKEIFMDYERSE